MSFGDDDNPDPRGPEHERTGEEPEPTAPGKPKPKPAPGPGVPIVPKPPTPDANPIDPRVFHRGK